MPQHRVVPAFLVGIVVLLFTPLLVGKVFVPGDFLYFIYPWKGVYQQPVGNLDLFDVPTAFYPQDVLLNEQLKKGDLPLWNPRIFSGHPAFASGQSALVYPPRLLFHRVFDTALARSLTQACHLLAMGLFFFCWIRGRGLTAEASGVGACVWMLNGYIAAWMQFEHVLIIGTYLPAMLWCGDRALATRRWSWWALLPVLGALSLVGGHLQFNLYVGPLVAGYLILQARQQGQIGRALAGLGVCALGAVALAAPMILPFLEFQAMGQRPSFDWATLQRLSAPLWTFLLTLLSPDVFGNPASGFAINRNSANLIFPEFACYLGVIPLLLALVAVRFRPEARPWAALATVCLLCAAATPMYRAVVWLVPPLAKLIPLRILFVFVFAGAVLAALGAQEVGERAEARSWLRRLAMGLAGSWAVVMLTALAVFTLGRQSLRLAIEPFLSPVYVKLPPFEATPDFGDRLLALAQESYGSSPHLYLPFLLPLVLLLVGRRAKVVPGILLLVLTALDLMAFQWRFNRPVDPEELFRSTPGIEYLQSQPQPFRLEKDELGFYNTLTPYGLQLLTGYESIFPARYASLMAAVDSGRAPTLRSVALAHFDSPILDGLNLEFLLTLPWRKMTGERWEEVYAGPDMRIYRNRWALPRAYVVGEAVAMSSPGEVLSWLSGPHYRPGQVVAVEGPPLLGLSPEAQGSPVNIRLYEPDRVVLEADMRAPGLLVLSDAWHPGWSARVDGQPVPIPIVNLTVRGVVLPAGRHTVEFVFRPQSFQRGLNWARGAALCLLLLAGFDRWRGRGQARKRPRSRVKTAEG